jgi:hypothetical protein
VGASAATIPFIRGLPGYAAGADKRYLILLFTPNGVVRHLWGANQTSTTPGDFTLRPWLEPLRAYKDKMVIVRGLANKAAGVGDPHGPGMASLWTGARSKNQELAGGPSIDQVIAQTIKPPTPHATLEFRAKSPQDYEGKSVHNRMIYSAANAPKDPRESATAALSQLFVGIPAAGAVPTMPMVDPRVAVRQRVFTRLEGELGRLTPKLCTEDKRQLDALRDGWNTLSSRLGGAGGGALASCTYPTGVNGQRAYPMVTREHIDLLVMALACDLTRIASLQFSQALSPLVPDWLGITGDHHNISHAAPQRFSLGPKAPVESDADNPLPSQVMTPAIDQMTKINLFYAGEIAYLCDRLSQFSVGGGKTLLDQSIICWGNELDNGSDHDQWEMPFLLIGGGGGRLKTNQVVTYPVYNGYSKPKEAILTAARGHNDLLVTLAQLMGANISTFGDADLNKGPLPELKA